MSHVPTVHRSWLLTFHLRCFWSLLSTVVHTLDSGIFFSRFSPVEPPCSVSTGPPLVGCTFSPRTDGLVCKEVNGFHLKLHYCTPGLVRTSAESTSYKGTTSLILLEHYYYYYYYCYNNTMNQLKIVTVCLSGNHQVLILICLYKFNRFYK